MKPEFLAMVMALMATTAQAELYRQERPIMHTTVTIVIVAKTATPELEAAFDDAFSVFTTIDDTLNEWKPESALGKINAGAGGPAIPADPVTCDVVQQALAGAKKTGGLFDPTWAALKNTWKFGDDDTSKVPTAEEVSSHCALVGYTKVEVTPTAKGCTIRLPTAGMKLGLSGFVKGWGVDQAVAKLRKRGFKNFWVQAGGDLYFAGKNGDRPWKAGIRNPRGAPDAIFARLEVTDRAFSTSGDYEHFFEIEGKRYHHIIDPRTCWPSMKSRSATVLSRTATDAEFLTKSAFILGGDEGLALMERWGASGVVVDSAGENHASRSLKNKIEWVPVPPENSR